MSWRYQSYFSDKSSNFFYSEKDIDFTSENLDYTQFLLQEFFNSDIDTKKKISEFYTKEYGARSYAYLSGKYLEWANGDYHLTKMMKNRIISIMPKFLTLDATHKLGIQEFVSTIKLAIKSFQSNQNYDFRNTLEHSNFKELVSFFENQYKKIQDLNIQNIKYKILTNEEKDIALEISKYILELKLQEAFNQISRDFNIFLPLIFNYNSGVFSATYTIKTFNIKYKISNKEVTDLDAPLFKLRETNTNTRFKEFSDKYLAYELLSIHKEKNMANSNSFISINDIEMFFSNYDKFLNGDGEVNMNSTFQGEGGVLFLEVNIKSLNLLRNSIIASSLKLTIYIIIIIFTLNAIKNKQIMFPVFVYVILGWIVISKLINETILLFNSIIENKLHKK